MDLRWGLLLPIRRCLDSGHRITTKEVKAASLKHGTSRDFMRADGAATPFWTLRHHFFFFLSFSFLCFPSGLLHAAHGVFVAYGAWRFRFRHHPGGSGALFMFLAPELCEGIISSARFLRCLLSIKLWYGGDTPYQAFLASL